MKMNLQNTIRMISSILLLIALLCSNFIADAQQTKVKNLEKYDNQWIHFGFLLGTNSSNFRITFSDDFYASDSVSSIEPIKHTGFNLGIITNVRLASHFDLRFMPNLAFSQRDLQYQMIYPGNKTATVIKKVESTFLVIPLELKFKSTRINNYRFYVTGGFQYMIDMVSQAKVENNEQLVKLYKNDYGYTLGLGMDLYLPLFKFAPEIKVFQGMPNVLAPDPAVYTTSLQALKSKVFTISLTFE